MMPTATEKLTSADSLHLAAWVLSLNSGRDPRSVQNGELPGTFDDLSFLKGDYDGVVVSRKGLRTLRWQAQRMLNGWVIRDSLTWQTGTGGAEQTVVNLRTFSSDQNQWKSVSINEDGKQMIAWTGRRVGNTIIFTQDRQLPGSSAELQRQMFVPEGTRRFTLIEQASIDDGDTWFESRQPLTLHKIM